MARTYRMYRSRATESHDGSGTRGTSEGELALVFPKTVAAAIAALASETRLKILLVLWDAQDRPLGFSELRERVGVADPGQFRYHLRKLEDQFIKNTPAGYDITDAGMNVVWIVRSRDIMGGEAVDSFPIDSACPDCGAGLLLCSAEQLLSVTCSECDRTHDMTPFHPSGLVGRTPREVHATYERVVRAQCTLGAHDICPRCYATGSFTLITHRNTVPVDLRDELGAAGLADLIRFDPDEGIASVVWTCSQCGFWIEFSLTVLLCYRSVVAAFYRDHGVDVDAISVRDLPSALGDVAFTMTETDPVAMRVSMTIDDETLIVSVENGFGRIEAERVPAIETE